MKFYELIIAVDKDTRRVVWYTAYREWPRLIPGTPQLAVFAWRGMLDFPREKIDLMQAKHEKSTITLSDAISTELEKERLLLLRNKCILCWRWLIQLHDLSLSTSGMIPGVPMGKKGSNDRLLFEQEKSRMEEVIADEIESFHDQLWLAADMDELENIAYDISSRRHHNRQPYY